MPSLQEVLKDVDVSHYGPHVPTELVRMVGSHSAAHVFAQVAYWYNKMGREFYKTNDELAHEAAISKRQINSIRKKLEPFGLRTSRKGNSGLYYRIDWEVFKQAAASHGRVAETAMQSCRNCNPELQKLQLIPYIQRLPKTTQRAHALAN